MLFLGFTSGKRPRFPGKWAKTSKNPGSLTSTQHGVREAACNRNILSGRDRFDRAICWVLVSEPGFLKVLAHFPGNRILLPEMKPRNNIVY